jgi:hypothetical protein
MAHGRPARFEFKVDTHLTVAPAKRRLPPDNRLLISYLVNLNIDILRFDVFVV